jgi:hypothetical protein
MRIAAWTKLFAAGWGNAGDGKAEGGNRKGRGWASAGRVSEKWTVMRAARSKPRPLGIENAAQDLAIGVSGYPRRLEVNRRPALWDSEGRVLTKQPRAETAAVGTVR